MSKITFVLLISLFFNLLGCRPAASTERAKGLIAEANKLLEEDVRLAESGQGSTEGYLRRRIEPSFLLTGNRCAVAEIVL